MEPLLLTLVSIFATAILGAIGYFLKNISHKIDVLSSDVADMRPKLDILWRYSSYSDK